MPSVKKKYKFPDDYYARKFNISTSSVFRYKKENAPLDDEVKFLTWIAGRSHKPKALRPKGELVRDLRVEVKKASKKPKVKSSADAVLEEEEQIGAPLPREMILGTGLRVEIKRQEAECAEAYRLYRVAVDTQDPLGSLAYHKIWVAAQKSLRELSKDVPKSEKDDDKALASIDVETAWLTALSELKTMLENVPAAVSLGVNNVEPDVRIEIEKIVGEEIGSVISAMRLSPWIK